MDEPIIINLPLELPPPYVQLGDELVEHADRWLAEHPQPERRDPLDELDQLGILFVTLALAALKAAAANRRGLSLNDMTATCKIQVTVRVRD